MHHALFSSRKHQTRLHHQVDIVNNDATKHRNVTAHYGFNILKDLYFHPPESWVFTKINIKIVYLNTQKL